jgi:TonB family protein
MITLIPALSLIAKATLVLAVALVGVSLARRSRAAVRHALLAAAFGVLLVLPAASVFSPPVRVVLPVVSQGPPATVVVHNPTALPPAPPRPAVLSPADLLMAAWVAGALFFLLRMAAGLWQVRSLRRSAIPWPEGQRAAARLTDRPVEVLLHEKLSGPMTCGVLRPAVFLPQDAPAWQAEELDRALMHELEHVRRFDWLIHCASRVVCAAYWFHPLVWIARRRMELEAERACDDAVLRHAEAATYAEQLIGLARRLSASAKSPLLAMAHRADLPVRVRAALDNTQQRGRAGNLAVALACAAAAAFVVTMSPLRLALAAPQAIGRFAVSSQLVMVQVTVTHPSGTAVEGLTAADFVVTEDGAPQTISVFEFQKPEGQLSFYLLGYYTPNPKADGQYRKLDVVCKGATTAKVHFRAGYFANPRPESPEPVGAAQPPDPSVTPPRLIFKVEPEYSDAARKAKYQGTVLLAIDVNTSGQAEYIKVVRSLGLGLDEKAIEAVKRWRFKPGTKDGNPATLQTTVEVTFRLL